MEGEPYCTEAQRCESTSKSIQFDLNLSSLATWIAERLLRSCSRRLAMGSSKRVSTIGSIRIQWCSSREFLSMNRIAGVHCERSRALVHKLMLIRLGGIEER